MSDPVSRRQFVCGGCALVAAGCAPGSVGGPVGPVDEPSTDPSITPRDTADPAGSVTTPEPRYPCGQAVPVAEGRAALPLADYPELADVGGWVAVNVGGREIVVAHVETDCFAAILRACTHEGVPINYRPDRFQFACPRHGALYDLTGVVVGGPAPRDLPVYPVAREGDVVWVDVTA